MTSLSPSCMKHPHISRAKALPLLVFLIIIPSETVDRVEVLVGEELKELCGVGERWIEALGDWGGIGTGIYRIRCVWELFPAYLLQASHGVARY